VGGIDEEHKEGNMRGAKRQNDRLYRRNKELAR
jgi:hypothetical protein